MINIIIKMEEKLFLSLRKYTPLILLDPLRPAATSSPVAELEKGIGPLALPGVKVPELKPLPELEVPE